jgi:hypothetical protein
LPGIGAGFGQRVVVGQQRAAAGGENRIPLAVPVDGGREPALTQLDVVPVLAQGACAEGPCSAPGPHTQLHGAVVPAFDAQRQRLAGKFQVQQAHGAPMQAPAVAA